MPKQNRHRKPHRANDQKRSAGRASDAERKASEPSFANQNIAVTQREQAERRLERAETGRDIWERVEGEQGENVVQQPDAGQDTERGGEGA